MLDPVYSMSTLFDQLGLKSTDKAVEEFIAENQISSSKTKLHEAPMWSASQARFLREMKAEDADWAIYVDELDARLRGLN